MSRSTWARILASAVVLALIVWRLGAGPFLDGLRMVNGGALAAAAAIVLLTTVCSAWRWKTVAAGLGVGISLPAAVAAYYRALFLNVTLPGGVAGDVHRGLSHGRDVGDVGRALRAVVLERFAGQVVQAILTLVVLLALPSPVHSAMPAVAIAAILAIGGVVLIGRLRPENVSPWARVRNAVAGDLRASLLARGAWPGIVLTSALVVAGHVTTFLIAARTAGASASTAQMLPLALLAILAMVLPSAGGWGPREGVTAWAFGAAGLGAQRGVATGVVYGLMVLVASLPGAIVLVVGWLRIRSRERGRALLHPEAVHV